MLNSIIQPNLLVELSTEEQEILSGGRKRCYKKCYWVCPKGDRNDRDGDRDGDRDRDDDDK